MSNVKTKQFDKSFKERVEWARNQVIWALAVFGVLDELAKGRSRVFVDLAFLGGLVIASFILVSVKNKIVSTL